MTDKVTLLLFFLCSLVAFISLTIYLVKLIRIIYLLRISRLIDSKYYELGFLRVIFKIVPIELHYCIFGYKKRFRLNEFFDSAYYLENNADVEKAGYQPLLHYLEFGAAEGRNPHQDFDTNFYLETYPDVVESGINPLVHFLKYGRSEGRAINPNMAGSYLDYVSRGKNEFINFKEDLKFAQKVLVVFHVYHEDLIREYISRLQQIPFEFDLLVTTPLHEDASCLALIRENFPSVEIRQFANSGRDIGPFLSAWQIIRSYDLCLKLHTKKGGSSYVDLWRGLCLDGVLGSTRQVCKIAKRFELDDSIAIAGPEPLYASLNCLVGVNGSNIESIISKYQLGVDQEADDHGFFMGTIFWFRPSAFGFLDKISDIDFGEESGVSDGRLEHAVERILGTRLLAPNWNVLLLYEFEKQGFVHQRIVNRSYVPKVKSFHAHFDSLIFSKKNWNDIKGHCSSPGVFSYRIDGWLALSKQSDARSALLVIDDEIVSEIFCNTPRQDLKGIGCPDGKHAFESQVPIKYRDGLPHQLRLIDRLSGKCVYQCSFQKSRLSTYEIAKDHKDWDEHAESKFLGVLSKQSENSKAENRHLTASIVMPTFNRAGKISAAIQSVVSQSHNNFELIIIDDGSTDRTEEVVEEFLDDPRIVYKKIESGGVSRARNVGLALSTGDYQFFLDSDNEWLPEYIATSLDYMQLVNIPASYCAMKVVLDEKVLKLFRGDRFSYNDCAHDNYIDLNCFSYKRTNELKNFRFDESLRRLVDWELILRITKNHPVSYAPFLGVIYYDGSDERITNKELNKRNELRMALEKIRNEFLFSDRLINDEEYWVENLLEGATLERPDKKVSIDTLITSYNHQSYISEAIDSVVCQKGEFTHRIYLADDASNDRTQALVSFYSEVFPENIVNLSVSENLGVSQNMKRCFDISEADYIAICEGDDYWLGSEKLEKHISLMELDQEIGLSFNKIDVLSTSQKTFKSLSRQESLPNRLTGQDFLNHESLNLIANFSSCVFRKSILDKLPDYVFENRINEIVIAFHFDRYGFMGFLDEPLSVYRQHPGGLWTGSDRAKQLKSGLAARETALKIADSKYREQLIEIIDNKFKAPLSELENINTEIVNHEI